MGDNTEIIMGDIPEVEGYMLLRPEEVNTISPTTKNTNGKVSNNNNGFYPVNPHNN